MTLWARRTLNTLRSDRCDVVGFVLVLLDRTTEERRERSLALLAQAAAGRLAADNSEGFQETILTESGMPIGFEHAKFDDGDIDGGFAGIESDVVASSDGVEQG